MAKFRATSDTSAPGWTSTAGTLAAAINEVVADDASFVTSPTLAASVAPYRFAIGPIAAGTVTKTVRAQRTGSVGDVRLVFFDAGGVEVGASAWQAVTPDWADYTLPVTTTATATQAEIQVKGAVAYSPLTLFAAGEQGAWYDPSDFSTMFQDAAGTVPVTAVEQPVGRINDKSGRGNHATQATTASKPVLQQDGNGKYYLAFDGVDDSIASASINLSATADISLIAGTLNSRSGIYNGCIVSFGAYNANAGAFEYQANGIVDNSRSVPLTGGGVSPANRAYQTFAINTAYVDSFTANFQPSSGPEVVFRSNGASKTLVAGGDGASASNFGNFVMHLGRRLGLSQSFNGRIYQLILRGALTDAAGITAAEAFVNTKTAAY